MLKENPSGIPLKLWEHFLAKAEKALMEKKNQINSMLRPPVAWLSSHWILNPMNHSKYPCHFLDWIQVYCISIWVITMQAKLSYIRLLYVITVIPAAAVFIQSRSRSLSEPLLYHTTNGPNLSLLTGGFPKPKLPHSMHSSNNNLIRPIDSSRIQTTLRLTQ